MLNRFFTPPKFKDDETTHQAYLLHIILLVILLIPIPFVGYLLIQKPEEANKALTIVGAAEIINIILFLLLRRGYVRLASLSHIIILWLTFVMASASSSSIYGVAFMLGNGLTITIAGILLGGRGALAMTLLAIAEGGVLVYIELRGWTPPDILDDPLSTWIVIVVLFAIGAGLQNLASREVRAGLLRARESEERYRLISQVSSDYTFSTALDREGNMKLNWVAGAFEEITGYSYEEYVANGGWFANLHPDDFEKDAQATKILKTNKPAILEVRTFKRDLELRWARVYANPVWDEQENRLKGIVGAVQDITDRKQVEEERETLIRELEAKNAELERFTYTVSHDLKSPLVTITGFLGFLEQDAVNGNAGRIKSSIDRISSAAKKMQALLNDLLELSRVGRLMNTPENVPFTEIVNEAIDHVRGRLDELDVIIELQREFPVVHGDRARLVEVMQNLIENAAKYSNPNTRPRIEIGTNGNIENGYAVFYVRDNGIGVEEQYHDRIFGLFNKLDPQSEGTGIGLSLVKRIIEVHNGRIWIESKKGKGAAFYFSLPTPQTKE